MVEYASLINADLGVILTALENAEIGAHRVVNIFHNGTEYVAVYVITN
jgi:hypothetical protein